MAGYQRKTALSPSAVLLEAEDFLPQILGLTHSSNSSHSSTYDGTEGKVTITAHRHGPYTDVVATTDQLRTSRLDYEVQKLLNRLPYEPGDLGGPGLGDST